MVTKPARSRVLHRPQMPERHSKSMLIPAYSAISSSVFSVARGADFTDRAKVKMGIVLSPAGDVDESALVADDIGVAGESEDARTASARFAATNASDLI